MGHDAEGESCVEHDAVCLKEADAGFMKDLLVLLGLDLGFALLVTVHIAIACGIARRVSIGRAVVALLVPPLAPYWAARHGMRLRAGIWLGSILLYGAARAVGAAWAA